MTKNFIPREFFQDISNEWDQNYFDPTEIDGPDESDDELENYEPVLSFDSECRLPEDCYDLAEKYVMEIREKGIDSTADITGVVYVHKEDLANYKAAVAIGIIVEPI